MNRYLILGFLSLIRFSFAYDYELVVAAIFKDEAPYFKEWIEYHKMLGVEHFRLYNNDSRDNYLTVLQPYIQRGEVTLIDWPSTKEDLNNWCLYTQWPACKDSIEYYKERSKWLAIIDIDEFIVPLESSSITQFLENYESYPGVVINWQCFGTSYVQQIPPDKLMIEMLCLKAVPNSTRNLPVKSIVRPELVDTTKMAWSPHTFYYLNNQEAVFPDKCQREETLDISRWEIHLDKAVIHHYVHRTETYFWSQKIPKKYRMENGGVMKDQKYIKKWRFDCNQEEDKTIFRFVDELKKRIFEL
jgi:hypothetical protein